MRCIKLLADTQVAAAEAYRELGWIPRGIVSEQQRAEIFEAFDAFCHDYEGRAILRAVPGGLVLARWHWAREKQAMEAEGRMWQQCHESLTDWVSLPDAEAHAHYPLMATRWTNAKSMMDAAAWRVAMAAELLKEANDAIHASAAEHERRAWASESGKSAPGADVQVDEPPPAA